jgi:uncharacterized protein (DUF1501 family)
MESAEPHAERTEDSVSRREFLRAGGLSVVGLSLTDHAAWAELLRGGAQRNCLLVLMTGGASQLETFDPKPDAPGDVQGTLGAIPTSVPGIRLSETLPLLAQRAHRFSLIRSVHHSAAPIHETGLQLLQTGRLSWKGVRFPNMAKILTQAIPGSAETPFAAVLPRPLQSTGATAYLGQEEPSDGDLKLIQQSAERAAAEPEAVRRSYGPSRFGELLLQSRLLIEQGLRCVTVNLFDGLGSGITWDAHGDPNCGPATVADCRDLLCPAFDAAMSGLLDDLSQRGLLENTLVIAVGEMGRTPRINSHGGRDHWTNCWSALVAGGGTVCGQAIGASDEHAAFPVDRPVELGEIPASILHWFGIDGQKLTAVVGRRELPLIPQAPIFELWGSEAAESTRADVLSASA